jgi:hypothetical protein
MVRSPHRCRTYNDASRPQTLLQLLTSLTATAKKGSAHCRRSLSETKSSARPRIAAYKSAGALEWKSPKPSGLVIHARSAQTRRQARIERPANPTQRRRQYCSVSIATPAITTQREDQRYNAFEFASHTTVDEDIHLRRSTR